MKSREEILKKLGEKAISLEQESKESLAKDFEEYKKKVIKDLEHKIEKDQISIINKLMILLKDDDLLDTLMAF